MAVQCPCARLGTATSTLAILSSPGSGRERRVRNRSRYTAPASALRCADFPSGQGQANAASPDRFGRKLPACGYARCGKHRAAHGPKPGDSPVHNRPRRAPVCGRQSPTIGRPENARGRPHRCADRHHPEPAHCSRAAGRLDSEIPAPAANGRSAISVVRRDPPESSSAA
jgi:hypothetical protein